MRARVHWKKMKEGEKMKEGDLNRYEREDKIGDAEMTERAWRLASTGGVPASGLPTGMSAGVPTGMSAAAAVLTGELAWDADGDVKMEFPAGMNPPDFSKHAQVLC